MNTKMICSAALAVAMCTTAGAAELLLTQGVAKKGATTSIALDVVSDGDVRGIDFVIPVAKGMKVNTSQCLSALPKGFQGMCKFNGTEVAGMVFSLSPQTLPRGIHSIGSITFSGRSLPKSGLSVQFNAVDTNAKTINSKVTVE